MVKTPVLAALALLLVTGCATDSAPDAAASGSAAPSGPASGSPAPSGGPSAAASGAIFTTVDEPSTGTVVIRTHPLAADGSVGDPVEVASHEVDDDTKVVLDGVGGAVLLGAFGTLWTSELQVSRDGGVVSTTKADKWCGGQDPTKACFLLDEGRIARTSEIGADDRKDASVIISATTSGETVAEHGPFPDLVAVVPTDSPDALVLVSAPADEEGDSSPGGGTVQRLDVGSGTTSPLGSSPQGWGPICALGQDSVLGYTQKGDQRTLAVVGSATVADIALGQDDTVTGCSPDGQFLYVQSIPQPPQEENDDSEAKNPSTTVDRVTLADGSRSPVLTLQPQQYAGPVAR
jgi:hypothetical protein